MIKTYILFAALLIIFSSHRSYSQITLTAGDFESWLTAGTVLNSYADTNITQVNIGSAGSNNWDFSNLIPSMSFTTTSIAPSSTPYAADFAGAGYAFQTQTYTSGVLADTYVYLDVNTNYYLHGIATSGVLPGVGTLTSQITYNPFALEYQLPAAMGSEWSYSGTQTINSVAAGFPSTLTQNVTTNSMVDGYGSMILPGGRTVEALRIKIDSRLNYEIFPGLPPVYSRSISYNFISKYGDFVSVSVTDTNASNSGVVPVDQVSWNIGNGGTTSVESADLTVLDYNLKQNYPNPFNPSTKIDFTIPKESFVELKIYNILGSEVAALINQKLNAGIHSVSFNAGKLPSGIYFAELKTDNFLKVIKMNLIK